MFRRLAAAALVAVIAAPAVAQVPHVPVVRMRAVEAQCHRACEQDWRCSRSMVWIISGNLHCVYRAPDGSGRMIGLFSVPIEPNGGR